MQEINLLQNKLKDKTNQWESNNRTTVILLAIVVIAEIVAGGVLYMMKSSVDDEKASLDKENVEIQAKIDSMKDKLQDATGFQAQAKNLQNLLNNHVVWNSVVDEISKITLKKSSYMTMSADTSGMVRLEGVTPDYVELGKILLALETSSLYQTAKLRSSAPSKGEKSGVIYSIELQIDQSAFTYK